MADTASSASAAPTAPPPPPVHKSADTTPAPSPPQGHDGGADEAAPEPTPEGRRSAELTRKYAALSREQKAYKQRAAQVEAREQALAAREQEVQRFFEAKKRAAENPDEWLKQGNLSYDKVTDHFLKNQRPPEERRAEEYDKKFSEYEKRLQDRETQLQNVQQQFVKMQFLDRIKSAVQSGGDTYELIAHYDAHDDVFEYMDEYARVNGEVLDVSDACRVIEGVLEQEREKEIRRALASKKLATRVGWPPHDKSQPDAESIAEAIETAPPKPQATRSGKAKHNTSRRPIAPAPAKVESTIDLDSEWDRFMAHRAKSRK